MPPEMAHEILEHLHVAAFQSFGVDGDAAQLLLAADHGLDHAAAAGGFVVALGSFLLELGKFVLHDLRLAQNVVHVAHGVLLMLRYSVLWLH